MFSLSSRTNHRSSTTRTTASPQRGESTAKLDAGTTTTTQVQCAERTAARSHRERKSQTPRRRRHPIAAAPTRAPSCTRPAICSGMTAMQGAGCRR
jgi:hypothetical protein